MQSMYLPSCGRRSRALLSALCAGAVSKTATAPLEKIRLSMMTSGSKSSILDTVVRTWRSGGLLAFFNGNAAGLRLPLLLPRLCCRMSRAMFQPGLLLADCVH